MLSTLDSVVTDKSAVVVVVVVVVNVELTTVVSSRGWTESVGDTLLMLVSTEVEILLVLLGKVVDSELLVSSLIELLVT